MRTVTTALLAALFGTGMFAGIALTQAANPGLAATARADEDDAGGCVNPAGHERGRCKHDRSSRNHRFTGISGTVIAVNGDLVQFRRDDGYTITIDQSNLLRSGHGLNVGRHYTLRGSSAGGMFVARSGGHYDANPSNGYPYPGSTASVQGIITSIDGSRLTIVQGLFSTITIDDQQALDNGTAQNLYVGRNVTAYGYWNGGRFYATSIG